MIKAFPLHASVYKQKVKGIVEGALFPELGVHDEVGHTGGAGGLVIVRDLDLFSYCESCFLPFQVKCHPGYVPSGDRVVGLSKLSRVANVFVKRLQDPQRLADVVCSALHLGIKPAGVAVIVQCLHIPFPNLETQTRQIFLNRVSALTIPNISVRSLNLPFWSQCEHHLLPFHGIVHIGYVRPADGFNPVGTSLLQSIVHFYGFKLQVKERLTRQISEALSPILGGYIMVVVEANHSCMISRGIEKLGSNTTTIAVLSQFSTDTAARSVLLQNIPSNTTSGTL